MSDRKLHDVLEAGGPHAGRLEPLIVGDHGRITVMSEVAAEPVQWLWRSWIPLGMLTVLDGDPGLGKSTMMLDLAARLSRGDAMPDGSFGPEASGVVILSAEDDLARVIRPRLDAAGATLERIATFHIETGDGQLREPTIHREDLVELEHAVVAMKARLVIVDPLMAYLPAGVNAHRDQDVRQSLAQLRALAERTGAAILVIRHLNKNESMSALYRGGGSIGILGAARAALLMAADPDDPSGVRRVLASQKANLAPRPQSLRLRLVAEPGDALPRVSWEGESAHTPATLLAGPADSKKREAGEDDRGALDEAIEFLHESLAGGPVAAQRVLRDARAAGISERTLRRAKAIVGAETKKLTGRWEWRLREGGEPSPHPGVECIPGDAGSLGSLDVSDHGKALSEANNLEGCQDCQPADAAVARDEVGQVAERGHEATALAVPADLPTLPAGDRAHDPGPCPECGGPCLWCLGWIVCRSCHRRFTSDGAPAVISEPATTPTAPAEPPSPQNPGRDSNPAGIPSGPLGSFTTPAIRSAGAS